MTKKHFDRDHLMNMQVQQIQHMARQMDARETRTKSIAAREHWLQRQNNAAYRQEFDRLRGELSRGAVPRLAWSEKARLEARQKHLHKLFSGGNV